MTQSLLLRTCAAAVGLALSAPAFAVDLLQAWRDALSNDSQVASARAQLAATRELVPQAQAGLLPQVGASASVSRNFADTNVAPSRDFTSQFYGIQLSYPLYRLQNMEAVEQSKLQATLGEALVTNDSLAVFELAEDQPCHRFRSARPIEAVEPRRN